MIVYIRIAAEWSRAGATLGMLCPTPSRNFSPHLYLVSRLLGVKAGWLEKIHKNFHGYFQLVFQQF